MTDGQAEEGHANAAPVARTPPNEVRGPWGNHDNKSGGADASPLGAEEGAKDGLHSVRNLPGTSADGQWAQPGDLQGLKGQLVDLLKRNGGRLDLVKVPTEYRKVYGR
jgi:hypothetical protein